MMKYVGIHGFGGDDIEDASLVVRIGEEVKEYLSRGAGDGVYPGGYLEIDGRYMLANSDEQWMSMFGGGWESIMRNFDKYSMSLDDTPLKVLEALRERSKYAGNR